MGKISTYGNDTSPVVTDYALGNKASGPSTATFKLSDLITLFFNNIPNTTVGASALKVIAAQAAVLTSEASAAQSFGDNLTTHGPSVTVTVGNNGIALISIGARMANNTTTSSSTACAAALTGANTQAAADATSLIYQSTSANAFGQIGLTYLVTGLTPGSTTFNLQYKVSGDTGTFSNRRIAVVTL